MIKGYTLHSQPNNRVIIVLFANWGIFVFVFVFLYLHPEKGKTFATSWTTPTNRTITVSRNPNSGASGHNQP